MEVTKQVHAVKIPFKLDVGSGKTLERFVYAHILYGCKIGLMAEGLERRAESKKKTPFSLSALRSQLFALRSTLFQACSFLNFSAMGLKS